MTPFIANSLITTSAFAYDLGIDKSFDFVAPNVPNTTSANIPSETGLIVYDNSDDSFKGYDRNGNWQTLSTSQGSAVVSNGPAERVERASINGTTIVAQSGTWISSVSNPSTGVYSISVNTGIFSDTPTCVTSTSQDERVTTMTNPTSTTVVGVNARRITGSVGIPIDSSFNIICMGPR